jgi:diguanylate cyclase (GGDEF)-like protein
VKPLRPLPAQDPGAELAALVETLNEAGRRLEELTGGEVDSVVDRDGRTFMLRHAQEQLRDSGAERQAGILDSLPAHIALVDNGGRIVSVNQAWRDFADSNGLPGSKHGVGLDYLAICDAAAGDGAEGAAAAAAGIRAVLSGGGPFALQYACHSREWQRWFHVTVTPLAGGHHAGAVVAHSDITEQKRSEMRITRLNRVYAVLSGINALIVRVKDREELFRCACKIAVDDGGFRMAMIALAEEGGHVRVMASEGKSEAIDALVRRALASPQRSASTMVARALGQKTAVVSLDSREDPQLAFGKEYARAGVRSVAVIPIIVGEEARGVLALYSAEPGFFDGEEMLLLTELAGDIAFAIDHIEKQELLAYVAYYDPLTGLANRTLFLERVGASLRGADAGGHGLALFLVDVERFKNVNDSLGRPAGDALLKQVALWLTGVAGDADLVARLGADHFAVVLPEVRPGGNLAHLVEVVARRFLEHAFRLDDAVFRLAAKIGAAVYPGDGADAEILFRNAEAALKMAKATGERYLFHTTTMTEAVAGKLSLETRLRQAVDHGEFVLHYQPKLSLTSGKLTGVEALIRWNDPLTGLVPPGQFIPMLEETGLIYEVGRWALRRAIDDYLRWQAAGLPAVRVAVNVSPLQLRSRGFVAEIEALLAVDAHAPAGLELEITESLIMEDVRHSIASLASIRALGVKVAIDDFGTGFSSLSYLARLPVDTLKIDRSFVLDMTAGPQGLALVSTIINLAHSLKLCVVAEGVETEEQSRLLTLLDCDEMQGYLFARPVPGDVFEARFLEAAGARRATAGGEARE